jgi:MFS family permease
MFRWLTPQPTLSTQDTRRALQLLVLDGAMSQILLVLTTGAFLIGFALQLHASNTVIGLLAAVGPLSQIIQIPTIFLVERLRMRKAITVGMSFIARLFWLLIAATPWIIPVPYQIPSVIIFLSCYFGLGAMSGCSFNSWVKDVVPEQFMGTFFARRLGAATLAGAVLSLVAGIGVDSYGHRHENTLGAYSILFVFAAIVGLIGTGFLSRIAEPIMPETPHRKLADVLAEPWRDRKFRPLLVFLGLWNFAVNFAAPFFGVYMLRELDMTMTDVLALSVMSQLVNVFFFGAWGRVADRFSNKSVLSFSGPLFILSFIMWPFLTMPNPHMLTFPLLIAIHVLSGMSTAGVTLCGGNIALKMAPRGKATAYLATVALVAGIAATVSPILAGFAADYFGPYEMKVTLEVMQWVEQRTHFAVPTIDLRGLDFVFLFAFGLGILAMHRLLAVQEEGEVKEADVAQHMWIEIRRVVRQISTVAGMRQLTSFPYGMLEEGSKIADQPASILEKSEEGVPH